MYPKVVISTGIAFPFNHPRAAIKQRIILSKDFLKTIMPRGEVKMVDEAKAEFTCSWGPH